MLAETMERERLIPLAGCINFRDLGGYPTMDGRRVRWRRLFRSDSLHRMTQQDLVRVRDLGLTLAFDLRTPEELERYGVEHVMAAGVRHRHAPFIPAVNRAELSEITGDLTGHYLQMLERGRSAIQELFATLAAPEHYPMVLYCMAGKDRTGLAAALVLRALGVPDAHIVADYALTERYAGDLLRQRVTEAADAFGPLPPAVLAALPSTMEQTLAALDRNYGSTEKFLRECGVSREELEAVRAHLLEDAGQDLGEAVAVYPV